MNAFYFAFDKFAIAYKDNMFYFIDKKGDRVSKLGEWDKVEQFDDRYGKGFAKVQKNGIEYYLDTLGNKYEVAYRIEDLNNEIKALDLSEQQFNEFPMEVLNYPNVEVLIINGEYGINNEKSNNFPSLPSEISSLKNLKFLSLYDCNIQELPESIGQLQNLQDLYLIGNPISEEEKERIRKLLPNCYIRF